MAVTVQASAPAQARKRPMSLQDWLETRGAVVAFAVAVLSMLMRGAQFYSGGAFNIAATLGPRGMLVFNAATGLGLAIGCELVGSIAGRDWLYNAAQALEVDEQRGLTKPQRAARKKAYEQDARRAMCFAIGAFIISYIAAAAYAIVTTHASGWGIFVELGIAAALEGVVMYLGVFKKSHNDPGAEAAALGQDLMRDVMTTAAQRIRDGVNWTMQDVRLVARAIRDKREAERFEAAYLQSSSNEPVWSTKDVMAWLGDSSSEALRKKINRRFAALQAQGESVWKDTKTGAWQCGKGDVGRLFMDDFLLLATMNNKAARQVVATLETSPRQAASAKPHATSSDQDAPETEPAAAAPLDTLETQASDTSIASVTQ